MNMIRQKKSPADLRILEVGDWREYADRVGTTGLPEYDKILR